MMAPLKRIKTLNLYIGMNVWKNVGSESVLHNKHFVFKTIFFATIDIFYTQIIFCCVNTSSKHISSINKGSYNEDFKKKQVYNKVFCTFWRKGHLFPPLSKKCYGPVHWYQCFSIWKMVGGESLVHGRPALWPSSPTLLPFHRFIYACELIINNKSIINNNK